MTTGDITTLPAQNRLPYIILITSVAAFGGFLFGYDTAVIAGAIGYLQIKFNLSPLMVGWAASSAIWGCVLGAMSAGYLSDRYGRKAVLIGTAVLFALPAYGSAVVNDLTSFIIMRLLGGIGVGAASMLCPMYISEIAPSRLRGRLVTLYQLAIVLGINIIYVINLKISQAGDEAWNIEYGWRYMLGSEVIPAVVFFILLFFVPESPRWLAAQGKDEAAKKILEKINGKAVAQEIFTEISASLRDEKGRLSDLVDKKLRKPLLIGVVLALFSQITGINAVIYYAPEIFKSIGFGAESAFTQTIIIGVVNMLFTLVAIWLIDRAGRRSLLIWGVAGMIICLFATGICFHFHFDKGPWVLIFILGYIASFAVSLGPIPWVLMSEIFPTKIRGIAMSLATLVLWIGVVAITQLTPYFLGTFGGATTFWIFMVNAVIIWIFTIKKIPETKNRTLEEIERSWS
ncbi:sugar porter family MFS transporter [Dyadobacter fanqingshengii]|uniref:Sugar porter family MFS transporter n=1 Tax=Dyadobacter fanqingshengii TaxID=2906443 RepID=A0A9X1PC40_9BACT|nr:sugar porter family MFS transporter [Dyadobacter fanqingshengii]MCF0041474.1 sugar porter family MFS transporter [Dyadobacter fanqingshengii]USJ36807.1 sugar porter family MFS transporter [Dyadobacter fanqingshengii]